MNIFKKNNILIQGLVSDSFDYLQKVYSQSKNIFTVASAWGQILFVIQNLSQLILYFIEDSITELNIFQATRDYSVKSLARIAGYDPGRAGAAQGEISIKWNNKTSDIPGGAVMLKNNTRIRCEQNGLFYSLIMNTNKTKITLTPNSSKKFKTVQGTFKTANFTGNKKTLQSFNINSIAGSYIDQQYINVFINEEQWKRYDSLYDIPYDSKGFLSRMGISSGVDVYFGNTNFGRVPDRGSIIRVEYLETLGFVGNSISTKTTPLTFVFTGPGEDLFGNEINLNNYLTISNEIDPSFGTDPETIDLIRLVAPKTSRAYVFANAENYEIFLQRLGIFSQVSAFSTFNDDNLEDDNVIYIYLVPNINLNLGSGSDYFNLNIDDFILTKSQREKVLELIEDSGSMIASTVVKILEPRITKYVGNAIITVFEGYDIDTIKDNIREQISDYFINLNRRDRIPKSDIIAIIEGIPGIDSVSFYFIGQKNELNQSAILPMQNISREEKSKILGLNEYGDIIIDKDEIVLLRGGFKDRDEVYFEEGIVKNKPCSLNITVTEIVPKGYSSQRTAEQKKMLIARNK